MASDKLKFRQLMAQLRQGSQDAAWELIGVYGSYVERAVRRSLSSRLRGKFDSIDFVQSVWASFFRDREQFDELDEPEKLIAFLATVARNKVVDETRRRLRTAKFDVRRERSLEDSEVAHTGALADKQARPSQVAIMHERWRAIMQNQPPHYQKIISMRLGGSTFAEIGAALSINERTARRVIDKLLAEHGV